MTREEINFDMELLRLQFKKGEELRRIMFGEMCARLGYNLSDEDFGVAFDAYTRVSNAK